MPAIDDQRHIDVDDIAFTQRFVIGDAVAHHMIDRGAAGLHVAAVAQRGGYRFIVLGKLENDVIERLGRHAWHHGIHHQVQSLRRQLSGLAHALKGVGPMELDLAGIAQRRFKRIDIPHHRTNSCAGFAGASRAARLPGAPDLTSIAARV
jgi:hypothetical protein